MKKVLLMCLLLGLFSCSKKESQDYKSDPDEQTVISKEEAQQEINREKQRLLDSIDEAKKRAFLNSPQYQEKKFPKKFLTITNMEYKPNFWGTKLKFKVVIFNHAKITEYKDLKLRIIWYSATNSVIDEKTYIRYDYFQPNNSYNIGFELPPAPSEAKTFNVVIDNISYSKQYN